MSSGQGSGELARKVSALLDAAAGGRVLVLGSLPPIGRDLDLLARSPERERIERALSAAGLVRNGSSFALFGGYSAYGVELIAAERFLAPAAAEDLFVRARPIEGSDTLARPAPAHALLILARLVVDEGQLYPKRRARLERILAEDEQAWADAHKIAHLWRAERALELLERAASTGARLAVSERLRLLGPRGVLPRPRRGLLVALSGVDGAGKSSHARWLAGALSALGADVEVVWNDLLGNRALDFLAAPPKALLRLAGRGNEAISSYEEAPQLAPDAADSAIRSAWSRTVTLANATEQRLVAFRSVARGRVVVFDRSPLDLAVRMEVLYRTAVESQRRLVELAAPRPDLAFFLDVSAEVSLARKRDIWSASQLQEQTRLYRMLAPRFGARRLDGQRPPEELAAEIAQEAWRRLR